MCVALTGQEGTHPSHGLHAEVPNEEHSNARVTETPLNLQDRSLEKGDEFNQMFPPSDRCFFSYLEAISPASNFFLSKKAQPSPPSWDHNGRWNVRRDSDIGIKEIPKYVTCHLRKQLS